jgi:hypothetical protein
MRRDKDRWSPPKWVSSNRTGETLADDIQLLLGDLCREYGFCSALPDDILTGDGALTADAFVTAVLIAEGFPEDELPWGWRQTMTKVFNARYGPSISTTEYEMWLQR